MWRVILGSLCIAVCVGLIGCTNPAGKDKEKKEKEKEKGSDTAAADAKKLADKLDGNTYEKGDVAYTFGKEGKYKYKGGSVTVEGTWKAVDGKHVEMTFKLTDEQVKTLEPIFKTTKEGIDAANKALKTVADASGGLVKFEEIPAPAAPKAGENTWKEMVEMAGDNAKISGVEYKKK